MMEVLFMQHNHTITQFNGERIAHCSTERPDKDNWIELDLFISENDQWILQTIGRTRIAGQQDLYTCKMAFEPMEIIDSLVKDTRRYNKNDDYEPLSWPAKCILAEALKYLSECVCD
jgi:hypothetical protein